MQQGHLDEGLTVSDFPRSWWQGSEPRSGLERLHREIRRTLIEEGGKPFDEASALRLIVG